MNARPVPRVDLSNISLHQDLGRGGQGRVAAVQGFMIRGKWPAAAKIYAPEHLGDVDESVLEKVVGLPRQLPSDDGDWLLENTAWPSVVAEDDGSVCGFLMRTVPDEFYFDYRTRTLGNQRKLADVAFLLNSDAYVSTSGIAVNDKQRLFLLRNVAEILTRLHVLGIVVGDLSPKNLLFSLNPAPRCFLIDCDAAQLNGETILRQVETPDWEAPAAEANATVATDSYKFGLLACRLFARDQSSRDTAALRALSADLGRLADLSQQADPQARPAPGSWTAALDAAVASEDAKAQASAAQRAATITASPNANRISVPAPVVSNAAPPVAGSFPAPAGGLVPPARRRPLAMGLAGVASLLILALIVVGVLHAESHSGSKNGLSSDTSVTVTARASDPATATQPPPPTGYGLVAYGSDVSGDSQAQSVAQMFNTYFSGINDRDFRRALSVFDPNSSMNPDSPATLRTFRTYDSTSQDQEVVLVDLEPGGDGQVSSAELTFQSHQAPGYGPSDDPGQTCTDWDIIYELTTSSSGAYQIFAVSSDTHSGC